MEEKIIIKDNITKNLPYGALSKIARVYKEKTGEEITVKQVANVCSPKKTSWNPTVIAIAQELILSEKKEITEALEKTV